jgi:hypothetical protein
MKLKIKRDGYTYTYRLGTSRHNRCNSLNKIGMKIIGYVRDECYTATFYELHIWNWYVYIRETWNEDN